jgi:PPIC-type PPIASE domain
MSNQTIQKPGAKTRARQKATGRSSAFRRQTAVASTRRDGKPLIFGWGGHLTRVQKTRIQRRAAYSFFGVVVALIVGVFAFGLLQQNVLIPNATIAAVNGAKITQETYRKTLAYNAAVLWNHIEDELKQQTALAPKVQAGDTAATNQQNILSSQIQADESNYQQAQITLATMNDLTEDQLIQHSAQAFEQKDAALKSKLEPSQKAVDDALNTFKKSFPPSTPYSQFLQQNQLTEADVRAAVTLQVRRQLMQTYLASLLVSPTRQAHIRKIEVSSQADGNSVRAKLTAKNADWKTIAKQDSLDANTKTTGGDAGFVAPGLGDAGLEIWIFDPARKVNDLSPVLKDASGTFDVVQILGFDDKRPVDSKLLTDAKNNALAHFLDGQRVAPTNTLTTPNQDMLNATRNLPVFPDLNFQFPSASPTPAPVQ